MVGLLPQLVGVTLTVTSTPFAKTVPKVSAYTVTVKSQQTGIGLSIFHQENDVTLNSNTLLAPTLVALEPCSQTPVVSFNLHVAIVFSPTGSGSVSYTHLTLPTTPYV